MPEINGMMARNIIQHHIDDDDDNNHYIECINHYFDSAVKFNIDTDTRGLTMSKDMNGRETNIEQLWCDLDDANARIKELTKKSEDCTIVLEPHQCAIVLNGDGSISAAYMPKTGDDDIAGILRCILLCWINLCWINCW